VIKNCLGDEELIIYKYTAILLYQKLKSLKNNNIMTKLIIIKTENSEKVRNFLNKEQINYQVFSDQDQEFSQDDKLLQEYQEA
jgi:choline kinase